MEIIYIDYLFLLNLGIDYIILLLTAKICAAPFRRLRFLAAAGIGAAYSAALVFPPFAFLAAWPMKIVLSVVMILVAFGSEKRLMRSAVVFYAVSAAFGGAVIAASMLSGAGLGSSVFFPVSMRVLIPAFAVCYAAVSIVFRRSGLRAERTLMLAGVTAFEKTVELRVLRDTGNNLRDPVSGSAVMVVERRALEELFPEEVTAILRTGAEPAKLFEAVLGVDAARGRFRLVPYTAVGVSGSLLLAFRPDELTLDGDRRRDIIVAISPTRLCEDGEYSAVV